jgi:hypothetical protein
VMGQPGVFPSIAISSSPHPILHIRLILFFELGRRRQYSLHLCIWQNILSSAPSCITSAVSLSLALKPTCPALPTHPRVTSIYSVFSGSHLGTNIPPDQDDLRNLGRNILLFRKSSFVWPRARVHHRSLFMALMLYFDLLILDRRHTSHSFVCSRHLPLSSICRGGLCG